MRSRWLVHAAALVALGFLSGMAVWGQPLTTPVNVTPDCGPIFFDLTANASSASFDNRFIGCKTWYIAYTSTGFPALILTFESDTDTTGVPTPGAWVPFAGAVLEGVNPNVAVNQENTVFYGYYPWIRATLTGATAGAGRRLRGTFYGYRQIPVSLVVLPAALTVTADQGAPNTDANRWPVYFSDGANPQGTQTNPLFARLSDGTNPFGTSTNPIYAIQGSLCTSKAVVTLSAAGATQVIAASLGKTIRICHVSLSAASPVNVQLIEGTGGACAAGTASLTGNYLSVLGMVLPFESNPLTGSASQALCVSLGAAVTAGGVITYVQN
jgi:hypothetical protein